jgi:hypothetical protein
MMAWAAMPIYRVGAADVSDAHVLAMEQMAALSVLQVYQIFN